MFHFIDPDRARHPNDVLEIAAESLGGLTSLLDLCGDWGDLTKEDRAGICHILFAIRNVTIDVAGIVTERIAAPAARAHREAADLAASEYRRGFREGAARPGMPGEPGADTPGPLAVPDALLSEPKLTEAAAETETGQAGPPAKPAAKKRAGKKGE